MPNIFLNFFEHTWCNFLHRKMRMSTTLQNIKQSWWQLGWLVLTGFGNYCPGEVQGARRGRGEEVLGGCEERRCEEGVRRGSAGRGKAEVQVEKDDLRPQAHYKARVRSVEQVCYGWLEKRVIFNMFLFGTYFQLLAFITKSPLIRVLQGCQDNMLFGGA